MCMCVYVHVHAYVSEWRSRYQLRNTAGGVNYTLHAKVPTYHLVMENFPTSRSSFFIYILKVNYFFISLYMCTENCLYLFTNPLETFAPVVPDDVQHYPCSGMDLTTTNECTCSLNQTVLLYTCTYTVWNAQSSTTMCTTSVVSIVLMIHCILWRTKSWSKEGQEISPLSSSSTCRHVFFNIDLQHALYTRKEMMALLRNSRWQ